MKKLEKKYNFAESEKKWQNYWEEEGIYKFDWNDVERDNSFAVITLKNKESILDFMHENFFNELAESYIVDENLLEMYWLTFVKEKEQNKSEKDIHLTLKGGE